MHHQLIQTCVQAGILLVLVAPNLTAFLRRPLSWLRSKLRETRGGRVSPDDDASDPEYGNVQHGDLLDLVGAEAKRRLWLASTARRTNQGDFIEVDSACEDTNGF